MHTLNYYNEEQIAQRLNYPLLLQTLQKAFQSYSQAPARYHHQLNDNAENSPELLLMPAWTDKIISVKLATIFPNNSDLGLPTIAGVILLFDGKTGIPLAILDAGEITARRTAAASALASSYLSRSDAKKLLIVGTGRLVSYLAEAHNNVRSLTHIAIWGRDKNKAEQALMTLPVALREQCQCTIVEDLALAAAEADIISTATRSTTPLIKYSWLSSGTHLDLVGGYRPDMREVDDNCVSMASLFADSKEGVLAEAGDFIQPINKGLISASSIKADLYDLCRGLHKGRADDNEITLFKSVGNSLEDLSASSIMIE